MNKLFFLLVLLSCSVAYSESYQLYCFSAPWCGPCKVMEKTVWMDEEIEKLLVEKDITRISVNGDKDLDMMKNYKIKGFPTVLLMKKGDKEENYKEVDRVGTSDKAGIIKFLERVKKKNVEKSLPPSIVVSEPESPKSLDKIPEKPLEKSLDKPEKKVIIDMGTGSFL